MAKTSTRQTGLRLALLAIAAWLIAAAPEAARAVFSGDMSPKARSGDADYADGMDAWEAKNWDGVVRAMKKVVERRPWHDKAWTRLGYAFRKLQRYNDSLEAYGKALAINPEQREGLEYLGEAYLELGRLTDAMAMLDRLKGECARVMLVFTDGYFRNGCGEYSALKAKVQAFLAEGKRPEPW